MEPPSSPHLQKKKSKSRKLTPCRFCLGLVVLFIVAVLSVIVYISGSLALAVLGKARFPHLAHHHPRNESMEEMGEEHLVRSFYGREKDGGVVEKFDLIATIYYRVMVRNETEVVVGGLEMGEEDGAWVVGSKDEEEKLVWGPWERIFSEVVLEGLTLRSKGVKTVAKVVLPGRIM